MIAAACALGLAAVLGTLSAGHPWLAAAAAAAGALIWLRELALRDFLRQAVQAARDLSGGDYRARVRESPRGAPAELAESLNTLAESVQAAVAELAREKAQLSSILDNVVEAIVAVSPDGRVIGLNPALCRLFSVDPASALERPFVETLRHTRLNELLADVIKEGNAHVEEVELFTPEERVFEAHAVPLVGEGRRAGALLVLHDITRLRRLESLRRDFVANVSHELRTPLASIKASAETLREGALQDPEHGAEFVAAIETDAERLAGMVDDLLDLAAVESGQRPPRAGECDVAELAREAAQDLARLARKKNASVVVEAAPSLPPARGDREQLKQVLANLIENAIKFNREGGEVRVEAKADAGRLTVSVTDTGVGISPEHLPRIFERFYRVDPARSREAGGTGLGLSIVKHIVEAHGGSVSVESRPNEGSTFRFTLPQ